MTNNGHRLIQMGNVSWDRIFKVVPVKYAEYLNRRCKMERHMFPVRPGRKVVPNRILTEMSVFS